MSVDRKLPEFPEHRGIRPKPHGFGVFLDKSLLNLEGPDPETCLRDTVSPASTYVAACNKIISEQ